MRVAIRETNPGVLRETSTPLRLAKFVGRGWRNSNTMKIRVVEKEWPWVTSVECHTQDLLEVEIPSCLSVHAAAWHETVRQGGPRPRTWLTVTSHNWNYCFQALCQCFHDPRGWHEGLECTGRNDTTANEVITIGDAWKTSHYASAVATRLCTRNSSLQHLDASTDNHHHHLRHLDSGYS